MIDGATLPFLEELRANNEKVWFDAHRDEYTRIRLKFVDLLRDMAERIAFFDESVRLHLDDPALVKVFRINRDLRFSRDKRPYKTNLGGTIGASAGSGRPLYYVSIEPGNCMVGGGVYMPPSTVLQAIREKVAKDYGPLRDILDSQDFRDAFPQGLTQHGALKTAPRGYSVDHPAIDLLRLKSYAATHSFGDGEVTQESFEDNAIVCFEALRPLNDYVASALS